MYAPAAYPAAYPVYEQEAADNSEWSDVAMLAVAGALVGAVIGYKTKAEKVSMLGVSGREATVADKIRNA